MSEEKSKTFLETYADEGDEEEEEYDEVPLEDEDEEDEEPEPPKKRRVVGLIRRVPRRSTPREIAIPMMGGGMGMPMDTPFIQQQYFGRQPQQKEPTLAQRVRQDVMYQVMMEKEMRRAQEANQPQEPFNQRMLRVANRAAMGDGAGSKINIKTALFKKPNVNLPSPNTKRDALANLNRTIKKIAPKVATKKKR